MYLKALEVYGFKSFPDRTRLEFGGGLTAVVGPNGSGKSNISDAVRWVLGEQSAKQLRGAKMQSVIFGGTQQRTAMGFAQVSLVIDNSDHTLQGIQAQEVTVTRKLYRSGESEYRIGGAVVRLKDIWELFMDTGLGKDGYSIISQGKIGEVVSAKSAERREIFEEAAGISKYRYKKNEAQRKLDAAQENLLRLYDIVKEIEDRLEPLRIQSEKAVKFLDLDGTRKNLEISLWCETLRRSKQTLREQEDKLLLAKKDFDGLNLQIEQIETENESIFTNVGRLTIEIQRCNDEIAQLTAQMGQSQSGILVLENDKKYAFEEISRLEREQHELSGAEGDIDAKIAEKQKQIATATQLIEVKNTQIQQKNQSLLQLTQDNSALELQSKTLSDEMAAVSGSLSENKVRLYHLDENIARWQQSNQETHQKFSVVEQNLATANMEYENASQLLLDTESALQSAQNTKEGYGMKAASRQQAYQVKKERLDTIKTTLTDSQNKIAVLTDLKNNMDGFSFSVKKVTQAADSGALRGVLGPVATALSVQSKYALAVETALGASAQHLIVQDEAAAKAGIAYLKKTSGGRATFLPLSTIKSRPLNETGVQNCHGFVGIASELVSYDEQIGGIVGNLLGRIVVTEDLDTASLMAKKFGFRFRIVTLDGQVINAGGSYTGGQVNKGAGVFSRQSELVKLQERVVELTQEHQQLSDECQKLASELASLNATLEGASSEVITYTQDKIRLQGEIARVHQSQTAYQAQSDALNSDILRLDTLVDNASQERQQVLDQDLLNRQKLETLQQQLDTHFCEAADYNQTRQAAIDLIGNLRLEVAGLEKDVLLYKDDIILLGESKLGSKAKYMEFQNQIEAKTQDAKQIDIQILQLQDQIQHTQQATEQMRQKIAQIGDKRSEFDLKKAQNERAINEYRNTREKISGDLARLDERKNTLQSEFEKIVGDLYEQYGLTRQQAQELSSPIEDLNEVKRQLATIKNKIRALGSVNVDSIEEFDEISARHQLLTTQIKDVEDSRDKLGKLIHELTREMITMFTTAFHDINSHFGKIFTDLFGGGSASLVLTEPENVLDSGIEINVSPPGKLIKDLQQLSGGEQALVAISIYFAILKVKPSPFCILDEIEAALDDVNVSKYAQYLRSVCRDTQFITITHRRGTMEEADILYGVTMQEEGVSKLLKLDVSEVGNQYK